MASTTPSPEFCIPTSIEIVRATLSREPSIRAKPYPRANPIPCSSTTAPSSLPADERMAAAFCPTMLAQTIAISKALASGATGCTARDASGRSRFTTTPAATGITTTCAVETSSPRASTSTRRPARSFVNTGVSTTAASVEQVVITTESATSPRAR